MTDPQPTTADLVGYASPVAKYGAALIAIAITLVGALAQLTGPVSLVDAIQLVLLGLNSVAIYLLPLVGIEARGVAKVAVAVAIALLTAAAPLAVTGHVTGAQLAVVVLAGLQVLGAHVGVQIRKSDLGTAA